LTPNNAGLNRSALFICAFLASTGTALAQWQVTASLGKAATSPSGLSIQSAADSALTVDRVHLRDESFDTPWYYGARLTRRLDRVPWLGLEIEFVHAKAIADASQVVRIRGRLDGTDVDESQPLGAILPRFELSHGLNFVLGNAVMFWPVGRTGQDPLLLVVGRFGAGPTVPHVEVTFRGHAEDAYQFGAPAIAGAVGGQIRISTHLAAVVEFKLTRTRQQLDVGSADIEGVFTTRHVLAGLVWQTTRAVARSSAETQPWRR
jgi:hypothetical protein